MKQRKQYQQTTSWRPKNADVKAKWKEIGASSWLNKLLQDMLGKKDEIPPKQP